MPSKNFIQTEYDQTMEEIDAFPERVKDFYERIINSLSNELKEEARTISTRANDLINYLEGEDKSERDTYISNRINCVKGALKIPDRNLLKFILNTSDSSFE